MKKIARHRATEKSVGERGHERREPQSHRARATRGLRAKSVSQPQQEPDRESHTESQAREMEKQTSALMSPVNSFSKCWFVSRYLAYSLLTTMNILKST